MKKKKQIEKPSKKVLNAWSAIAEYLHENEIYVTFMDIDYDEELTKVTKGKPPFIYDDYEMYRRFVLRNLEGSMRLESKNFSIK